MKKLGYILVALGVIGFVASFALTLDKIELIKNPNYQPACNINPLVSCTSVMASRQAEIFGFPNSIIGIGGFSMVVTVGMGILAGANFKRWFWLCFETGVILGIIFVHWLFYQSVFVIGVLCPYCMIVWSVTIPIFYYTTLFNLENKHILAPNSLKKTISFIKRFHASIILIWYLIIFFTILIHFWYFWSSQI